MERNKSSREFFPCPPLADGSRVVDGAMSVSVVDCPVVKSHLDRDIDDGRPSSGPSDSDLSIGQSPKQMIAWLNNDPENPYNWSSGRKIFIVTVLSTTVLNVTLGSSLPSNAIPFIMKDFSVIDKPQAVLPISVFLVGYVLGPLFFAPLSENYGRRDIMILSFCCYVIFSMACAIAPSWTALLIFRLLCGIVGSAPVAVVGGVYADIYAKPATRGVAMAVFMATTGMGPLFAPIFSGFVSPALGWRWTFWLGLMLAGVSLPPMFFVPETYGPVLLARRASHLRWTTGNPNIFVASELEKSGFKQLAMVTLTRPLRMLFFEPIVTATCLYLSLVYSIFYMYFEAYPIIFQGTYGMNSGVSGLMFLPIAAGELLAIAVFMAYDSYLRRAKVLDRPWTKIEESRRLPIACFGGPFLVIALFWLAWSARPDINYLVPAFAGLLFGLAFQLVFMALLNYLTDAYEVFAASALAAASCSRSILGAVLPLATTPMYAKLGITWAGSLLGFMSLLMCVVPFAFLRWGAALRARSRFCQFLKEKKQIEHQVELDRKIEA